MGLASKGAGRKRTTVTRVVRKGLPKAVKGHVMALAGSGFVTHFIDKGGIVDVDRVADTFRMTKGQLAETVGLGAATIGKAERKTAPRTQSRVREMLEIVARIRDWTGGETQAMAWYRSQPIPALDGRTPEALVKAGEAGAVRDYLDHLALGGFA
jgi:uncharacterized protein (DUF2384 family)